MLIKYKKFFGIYDVLKRDEPYMPKTNEEWKEIDYILEVDIPYDDVKVFQEIWWEDFSAWHYGNELPLLYSFKLFFDNLKEGHLDTCYDYTKLCNIYQSEELCWAIITILDISKFLDWGTSIRFGWLDYENKKAMKLKEMFGKYSISILYQIIHLDFSYIEGTNEHIVSEQEER